MTVRESPTRLLIIAHRLGQICDQRTNPLRLAAAARGGRTQITGSKAALRWLFEALMQRKGDRGPGLVALQGGVVCPAGEPEKANVNFFHFISRMNSIRTVVDSRRHLLQRRQLFFRVTRPLHNTMAQNYCLYCIHLREADGRKSREAAWTRSPADREETTSPSPAMAAALTVS
jgi:hypothetical protein